MSRALGEQMKFALGPIQIFLLVGISFCLGRAPYKTSVDDYILQVEELEEDIKLLEGHLKYCWSELPTSHIRHGSIDN